MLSRQGIIPKLEAEAIRIGLVTLWREQQQGKLELPEEEDVHMAVEEILTDRLGQTAGLLHTARSRNDQVALDLRLHVREQCAEVLALLAQLVELLALRGELEQSTLLPSYTHRQRAQPITGGYFFASYAAMFARDLEAFGFVLSQLDALPLGVGAIAGTSLPINREITRDLLRFSKITINGMDTVGDRDFALDFSYATARVLLHASRLATDVIDFCSGEFGFLKLNTEISFGSSMMPQKRNPDVFELIRGKSGRAVGNLMGLLTTLKGLPGGYNRDLQEDRQPLLETGPLARGVVSMLLQVLPRITFDRERTLAAVSADASQATFLAESLVRTGVPFRSAYKIVGALVRACQERGLKLAQAPSELARSIDDRLTLDVLASAASVKTAVMGNVSQGGTGPESVKRQLDELKALAGVALDKASRIPRIDALFAAIQEVSL
jgi:argininosuccinate lyase